MLERLLENSARSQTVTLDEIGETLGALPVSVADIEALLSALEAAGRTIVGPEEPRLEKNLGRVIAAARALRSEAQGKPLAVAAVAERAGLSIEDVLGALSLLRVMQR